MGTECVIGYLHRGVEKIAEHRTYTHVQSRTWTAWTTWPRSRTASAIAKRSKSCSTSKRRPARNYIRVILTELNRLASHQLWLGTHALDIGAMTPLFYTFRDREEILKIFEKYCGARLTTHAFRIGGCLYETYDGFEQDVKKFLDLRRAKDRRVRGTPDHQPHLGRAHRRTSARSPPRIASPWA